MKYPQRPSFFENKYTRLLFATCAAQELGPYSTLMCLVIASKEDQLRYSKPVGFFNEQLQGILGLGKWESLNKARNTAVSKGWLYYQNQGKRKEGLYWVTIPEIHKETFDAFLYPSNGYKEGGNTDDPPSLPPPNGYSGGDKGGYKEGYKGGELPDLSLNPKPVPEETLDSDFWKKENVTVDLHAPDPIKFLAGKLNKFVPRETDERTDYYAKWANVLGEFGSEACENAYKEAQQQNAKEDKRFVYPEQVHALCASVAVAAQPNNEERIPDELRAKYGM